MTTFIVNTDTDVVVDDGNLSLCEPVNQANATAATDTIPVASAVESRRLGS